MRGQAEVEALSRLMLKKLQENSHKPDLADEYVATWLNYMMDEMDEVAMAWADIEVAKACGASQEKIAKLERALELELADLANTCVGVMAALRKDRA